MIFLGQPREASLANAHDANWLERIGLAWLALGCIAIGVLPQLALRAAGAVTGCCLAQTVNLGSLFWWLAPIAPEQASYSGVLLLAGIVAVVGYHLCGRARSGARTHAPHRSLGLRLSVADLPHAGHAPKASVNRSATCSEPSLRMERELPSPSDSAPRYRIHIEDRIWRALYLPIAAACSGWRTAVGVLQGGRLAIYLLYSFLTSARLLVFVL